MNSLEISTVNFIIIHMINFFVIVIFFIITPAKPANPIICIKKRLLAILTRDPEQRLDKEIKKAIGKKEFKQLKRNKSLSPEQLTHQLLSNIKKNGYSSFPLLYKINNKITMTPAEHFALQYYTFHAGHQNINNYLRASYKVIPIWEEIITLINQSLSKHDRLSGLVYRGTSLPIEQIKKLKIDSTFQDKAFLSASTNTNSLKMYAHTTDQQKEAVLFHIISKNGLMIDDSTAMTSEAEILFRPNTKFLIISKYEQDNFWIIKMTELLPSQK